jgi:hypothetical protein
MALASAFLQRSFVGGPFFASLLELISLRIPWGYLFQENMTLTRFCGSPALPVLSHCVDPPRNQCRTALRDVSPKNHPSHIE